VHAVPADAHDGQRTDAHGRGDCGYGVSGKRHGLFDG
jgi:hypothetical protein